MKAHPLQYIIDGIRRRKKKKAKNRARRKLARITVTTKNNRRHKLNNYQGRKRPHSTRSWRGGKM